MLKSPVMRNSCGVVADDVEMMFTPSSFANGEFVPQGNKHSCHVLFITID